MMSSQSFDVAYEIAVPSIFRSNEDYQVAPEIVMRALSPYAKMCADGSLRYGLQVRAAVENADSA